MPYPLLILCFPFAFNCSILHQVPSETTTSQHVIHSITLSITVNEHCHGGVVSIHKCHHHVSYCKCHLVHPFILKTPKTVKSLHPPETKKQTMSSPSPHLQVFNLPPETTEDTLRATAIPYGPLLAVRLGPQAPNCPVRATLTYIDPYDAEQARLNLNNATLHNHVLRVRQTTSP